jgi:lantibiotic transport system ATP-binding protein
MSDAISTTQLTRRFPQGGGIADLDLAVPVGSIYGFLGPNGAGKTTTIRLLLGLLRADRGEINFFAQRASRQSRAQIAALVESPSLYGHLTGRDNLEVTRRLLAVPRARIDQVLARVGLRDAADQRAREYSLGMRQRLGLALTLLGEPKILILDEPSNGLDPAGIAELRALLRSFVELDGLTIFMSSHLLSEVEQLATHVGVLGAGKLLFQGSMSALRQRATSILRVHCDRAEAATTFLLQTTSNANLSDSLSIQPSTDSNQLLINTTIKPEVINRMLVQAGFEVSALRTDSASLEDLFFQLTGAPHG